MCPVVHPTPGFSGNHGVHPPHRKGAEGIPSREGANYDSTSVVVLPGHNELRTSEPETPEEADPLRPVKRLNGEVTRQRRNPYAGGERTQVWIGLWTKGGGEKVCLKTLRTTESSNELRRKRLEAELPRWAELRHPHVLPLYGMVTDIGAHLFMVTPWREDGNLLLYVKNNPRLDKNSLLRGSACGLSYLHSRGIVHGSVKCNNVLVSQEGEPQICDFGIAGIMTAEKDDSGSVSSKEPSGEVARYAAPELIIHKGSTATTHSDTYSFAMLILECITEAVPFPDIIDDAGVIHARISKRQTPPRPSGQESGNHISDNLWHLMHRCWSIEPHKRPTMEHVHHFFLEIS
ncbi:kinase-like domain-containing protein [Thelephora terrestris]|uniref:Kinase-like domain-containing protein n=1 Tax=Thelephora terrestris TaxID=56493 RepID=A0A9P6L1R7_9AGAM|nr:kinase-like domain-containing protein [Thelephora terrestris]